MFLDLLCPDCKASWPIVLQVIQAYGTKIHFRIHTFPLPYHTNAFVVAQGLHVVANATNAKFRCYLINMQLKYLKVNKCGIMMQQTSMTMPQVVDSLATFVDKTWFSNKR